MGSQGCLWLNDNETMEKFNSPSDVDFLETNNKLKTNVFLSSKTIEMIKELDNELLADFNENFDFYHDGNIDTEKEFYFSNKAKIIYRRIINEIGKDFEIIWRFDKSWLDES